MRCLVATDKYVKGKYLKVNSKEWEVKHNTENVKVCWKCCNYDILKGEGVACS